MRNDEVIKKDIVDHLYWDDRIDASTVNVEVSDSDVTLTGTVFSTAAKHAATGIALDIEDVETVDNRLEVEFEPATEIPSDQEIRTRAKDILSWDTAVSTADISIEVEAGIVTLKGSVDAYWKKDRAEEKVQDVFGVVNVVNELSVVPTEDILDETIAEDVVNSLERNVDVNVHDIDVEVVDRKVTLSGTVPSWRAREAAYDAARFTGGVKDVHNNLSVQSAVRT